VSPHIPPPLPPEPAQQPGQAQQPGPGQPSRRQLLRGAGAGLGAVALAPALSRLARPGDGRALVTARASGDRSLDFDQGWKFVLVNPDGVTDPTGAYAGAAGPRFDDSGWQSVDLPHDWSIELTPVQTATTSGSTGFLPGGLGWYRKTFTLPPSLAGQRIWVEFDGVYQNPDVYLNGQLLGSHPYAYTGFGFDLTGQVHTDGTTPNVIAVKATNPMPSSRWYSGSGIFRHVHLIVTSPVHVARHGTFVTTPGLPGTLAAGYANVQVTTDVANDGGSAATVRVVTTARDAAGRAVGQGTATVSVAAGQTQQATTSLRISSPALWSPASPVLYTLQTDLAAGGAATDSTRTDFGVRSFTFDPGQGLSLNGQYLKLQGVDLHATQGARGGAVSYDAMLRQLTLMKGMGVNALRTAHNPPAPELVQICDRIGILLMVEAFDCWHTGKLPFDYHLYFDAWSDSDIREMVNASKNSPAVVLWSIGNETPDTGLAGGPAIARRLIGDIKAIDTTRPVVMGSDRYRSLPADGSPPDQILRMLDGLGLNYDTAMAVDALHAKYPGTFFFESESSSETSSRGVYADPQLLNTGENYTPGKRATSSYDNNLAFWTLSGEYSLKKDRDRRFFQGQFLWAGQDYIGEPTPYSVFPVKASFFGAVDTAGFAKDTYHLFRSQWAAGPMVHIVPMNWTDHQPGEEVTVWVYASADTVELFLNSVSLGVKTFDRKTTTDGRHYLETTEPTGDDKNYPSGSYTSPNGSTGKLHLTWQVPFRPGRLEAVARRGGQVVATDHVDTAGPPRALRVTPDKQTLTADGQSLVFCEIDVVDGRGVVVPGAGPLIEVRVSGAGAGGGVDSGHQESAQGYRAPQISAFSGKALAIVQATRSTGPVTLTATSPGLATATVALRAVAPRSAVPAVPGAPGGGAAATGAAAAGAAAAAPGGAAGGGTGPAADASYSGDPATVPAAMLDGDLTTGWSNFYSKQATQTLPTVSVSHPAEWVSLTWPQPQSLAKVTASFTTSASLALPARITVSFWARDHWVPVSNLQIQWATASNQPTAITFDQVHTTAIRLDMTSPSPGTGTGFLKIAELLASG
jgi:beta-galactosidase